MLKCVIFDLDGTLLNTIYDLNEALNHVFAEYNLSKKSVEETTRNIGNGIRNLIIRSMGSENNIDEIFKKFMDYYNSHVDVYTKPYDGINDLLLYLKNKDIKLAVISNKNIVPLTTLINNHFPNMFDIVLGDGMGYKRKPDSEIINECLNKLNIKKEEVVYIGDSDIDILTTNNSNILGIFVSYGYRDKKILEENGAKIICDSVLELKEYLAKLEL